MTEYGRGRGSEPWHPEDPLYGDRGWDGQQTADGLSPHREQPRQYPGQYQQQAPWDPQGAPYPGPQYPDQGYPQQGGQQGYPQQGYPQPQHPQPQQPQYPQQGGRQHGWAGGPQDTGQGYAMDPYGHGGPYGQQPSDPYGHPYPQQPGQQGPPQPYGEGRPHGHPEQGRRHPDPGTGPQPQYRPAPHERQPGEDDWQQGEDGPGHAFFADEPDNAPGRRGGRAAARDERSARRGDGYDEPGGHDDAFDDDHDDHDGGDGEGRRGGRPKKRRSGVACLFVAVVLGGGVAAGGWFAYDFYQTHFGPAPDFAGEGSGSVQVEIPQGAGTGEMGRILKGAGVVRSAQAFVDAAEENPKGLTIQPGVYAMKKEMSGAAAVDWMLSPESRNALIVPEGMRNAQVYAAIDKRLELKAGTTAEVAEKKAGKLGLPDWADDNEKIMDPLEGFLYPARYDVSEGAKPEDVLKKMIARAAAEYEKLDVEANAEKLKLDSPLQLVTVASLVQAEGKTSDDFSKMARVVYNRLDPGNTETYGKIEFDSAFNYLKGQSEINIGIKEIRTTDHPYNTYFYRGLPPGPIGNPGAEAMKAAIDPEPGDWYYFVGVDGENTKFAETHEEHEKLVEEFNANQKNKG
ncbi:endolytic transglycosylase MltG [Streptomyces sp. F63]|uniref:endolytic transglycosylase MltG n=1 Tax=Streptomyces sp. F63 TaxID=2824887 RepID=UPI001B35A79E|nr:endolytic transglycosylase MltG [Streptomyces sp. F63]MBQ0984164.1 endolytic transglycosylase MltG [Streptomyces sp. F63]